jgi:hypothetical protein
MRISTLVCACALAIAASETGVPSGAAAQTATAGMGGSSGGSSSGPGSSAGVADKKPNSVPLPAPEQDPAARSARSIECAHKADAQGLQGKPRKRFLRECRRGA